MTKLLPYFRKQFPPFNSFRTFMYCQQSSQYIRSNSKKNSFRGNYSRKYGNSFFNLEVKIRLGLIFVFHFQVATCHILQFQVKNVFNFALLQQQYQKIEAYCNQKYFLEIQIVKKKYVFMKIAIKLICFYQNQMCVCVGK